MNDYIIVFDQNGEPYLSHHGILGMKWGVRRYQNYDGTLTDAGKSRYGGKLAKDIRKADKSGNLSELSVRTRRALSRNKAIQDFEKTSETKKDLHDAHVKLVKETDRINEQINHDVLEEINKKLEKEFGTFDSLPVESQVEYLEKGFTIAKERYSAPEYESLVKKYDDLSKQYEKECRDYLTGLLGKYANETVKTDWAVKYNFETNEITKQTLTDLAGVEMLRRAGGKI